MPPGITRWCCAVGIWLLASCATYSERTDRAMADYRRGHFPEAIAEFSDSSVTNSEFLAGAEAGMVALTAGDFDGALEHLERAARSTKQIEETALLDPTAVGEELITWVLNDTFAAYYGEGYERVSLHACLALAYLGLGMVEDVLVETKLANRLLAAEQQLYDTEYQAGGLAHFLSAVGYELRGEPGEAYIDYRAMEAKGVGGQLTGRALLRLAAQLNRTDDLEDWRARWGEPKVPEPGMCPVVLIAGIGLGPTKAEGRLEIPTGNGLLVWTVPQHVSGQQQVGGLRLLAGNAQVESALLEDVDAVARRNLDDRLAYLAAKSAVRAVMKKELTRKLMQEDEDWGWVAGTLFALATERADLRVWSTLPSAWHGARAYVHPGEVHLELDALGGEALDLGTYRLEPGETLFIVARTLGPHLHAHVLGGEVLDPASRVPVGEALPDDQPVPLRMHAGGAGSEPQTPDQQP